MIDLAQPAFPGDDGAADPRVRALINAPSDQVALARSLRDVRLLACVVAVADRVDVSGADKDSHMAVVSMVAGDGRRGLLAFTGVDSLRAWDPGARPVPALGRDIARAALEEGAAAVVVDVAGPTTAVLEGSGLIALAATLDLAAVQRAIHEHVAGQETLRGWSARARDVREEGLGVDVLVELSVGPAPSPELQQEAVAALATALQDASDLARLVPGGVGVRSA